MNPKIKFLIVILILIGMTALTAFTVFTLLNNDFNLKKAFNFNNNSSNTSLTKKDEIIKTLSIKVINSVTKEPIPEIYILVFPNCPQALHPEEDLTTCGDRYQRLVPGSTNENGTYLIELTDKHPPHNVVHFQFEKNEAYLVPDEILSFQTENGLVNERTITLAPSAINSDAQAGTLIEALEIADNDIRVQHAKEASGEFTADGDLSNAFWRITYQAVASNESESFTIYIDPDSGKGVLFTRSENDSQSKKETVLNPWPDEGYAQGKVIIGFEEDYLYNNAQKDLSSLDINLDGTNSYWEKMGIETADNPTIEASDAFVVDVPVGQELEMAETLLNEIPSIQSASVCPVEFCK